MIVIFAHDTSGVRNQNIKSNTQVTERISKLTLVHAAVIYQISWIW